VKKKNEPVLTLALDRIMAVHPSELPYISPDNFNAESYFKDVIGVTVEENREPEKIVLYVSHKHANYIVTKPLHSSQKVIERDDHGMTIELMVQHNFELEKEILGMGEGMMVLAPEGLKRSIVGRLNEAIDHYNTSINEKGIDIIRKKLENKGFAVINNLFTKRALRMTASILHHAGEFVDEGRVVKTIDAEANPKLQSALVNRNIDKIRNQVSENLVLKEVILYQYLPDEWRTWGQSDDDIAFSLVFFLEHARISSFPLLIMPGSHKKMLDAGEQNIITENSSPSEIILSAGSGILIKPILLRRFHDDLKDKKIRFLEMRFMKIV
jgi:hypothetical protein